MSSLLWLLLYLAPLLGLTAALFAWFGWQWRGSDMQKRIDELAAQIETAQAALRQAETDRATALPASYAVLFAQNNNALALGFGAYIFIYAALYARLTQFRWCFSARTLNIVLSKSAI